MSHSPFVNLSPACKVLSQSLLGIVSSTVRMRKLRFTKVMGSIYSHRQCYSEFHSFVHSSTHAFIEEMPLTAFCVRTGSAKRWEVAVNTDLFSALTEMPVQWAPEHSKEPPAQATWEAWPGSFFPPRGSETIMEEPSVQAELKNCCGFYLLPELPQVPESASEPFSPSRQ